MLNILIFSVIYTGSISYNGLASDFAIENNQIWVSFPLENKVLNYSFENELKVQSPTVILAQNDYLYIVNNLKNEILVFKNKIFSKSIKLPKGDYVSGMLNNNKIYLLDRESAKITIINPAVDEIQGFNFINLPSYKPIDFKIFNNKLYVLDRRGPAPRLRIISYNLKGIPIDTLLEIKGTVGGGICPAVIDGKELLFISNALMGKIYIYSLSQNTIIDSFGNYGDSLLQFKTPTKITWKNDKLYILNQRNSRIDIFSFYPTEINEKPFDNINITNNSLLLNLNIPSGNYQISIFSVDGRKILNQNIKIINGKLNKNFPIKLKKGIYFIILKEKNGKFFIKKGVRIK